jgi:hypothetical protein
MLSTVNAVNHVNHVNDVKKPCPHHRRALARVLQRRLPASDFWTWLTSLTRLTLLTADVVDIIDGVRVPGDSPRVFGSVLSPEGWYILCRGRRPRLQLHSKM